MVEAYIFPNSHAEKEIFVKSGYIPFTLVFLSNELSQKHLCLVCSILYGRDVRAKGTHPYIFTRKFSVRSEALSLSKVYESE